MSDLNDYFSKISQDSKSNNPNAYQDNQGGGGNKGKRKTINLSSLRNLGRITVRPITDVEGRPLRLIHNLTEVYNRDKENKSPIKEFPRYFGMPDPLSFPGISQEDEDILWRIGEILDIFVDDPGKFELYGFGEGFRNIRKEVCLIYAKVFSMYDSAGKSITEKIVDNPGEVKILRHHSAAFYRSFSESMEARTSKRGNGDWLRSYFSRDISSHTAMLDITTKRPNIAYEVSFNWDEGAAYEITKDDLGQAQNLEKEEWSSTFDRSFFLPIRDKLEAVLEHANGTDRKEFEGQSRPVDEPVRAEEDIPEEVADEEDIDWGDDD